MNAGLVSQVSQALVFAYKQTSVIVQIYTNIGQNCKFWKNVNTI